MMDFFLIYFIKLIVANTVGKLLNVKIGYIVKIPAGGYRCEKQEILIEEQSVYGGTRDAELR